MEIFCFQKCLFEYENHFAVEKTQKKFCRRYQKKASHSFSIYGNCMIGIFLTKKNFFIFIVGYTEFNAKTREKLALFPFHPPALFCS